MDPQELVEAMRQMIKEEISAAVKPIYEKLEELEGFERGTRVLIENEVMPAVRTVAEQHGEIMKKIDVLNQRRESSISLRGRVQVLEDVVRNHTQRIEALEAKVL